MKYLILQRFRSYGVTLEKGTVVDETKIRSPRLRQSEGKIIAAVSSSEVPVEIYAEDIAPQETSKELEKAPLVPKFQLKK